MNPSDLKYTKEHEWIRISGKRAIIGITDYAQKELGDVVFVDLPSPGQEVVKGDDFAVVESVKAVSDVYAPISGTVVEVNDNLEDSPELLNQDPYNDGWIAVIEMLDLTELDKLMTNQEYEAFIEGE